MEEVNGWGRRAFKYLYTVGVGTSLGSSSSGIIAPRWSFHTTWRSLMT